MQATLTDVKQVAQDQFQNANIDEIIEENRRIKGTLVWDGFNDMDYRERMQLFIDKIWGTLHTSNRW